jgi:MFS family permease
MSFGSQLGVGSNMTPSVLAQIAAAYDATAIQGWISSGWLLSTCVAFVVAGRLSDIFGRRMIITGSNVLAVAGFAICAFAPNFSVSRRLRFTIRNQVQTDADADANAALTARGCCPTLLPSCLSLVGHAKLAHQVLIGGIILLGFAGGLAQTATAAACEIVPNKYRPVAIAFLELAIAPTGTQGLTQSDMSWAYADSARRISLRIDLCPPDRRGKSAPMLAPPCWIDVTFRCHHSSVPSQYSSFKWIFRLGMILCGVAFFLCLFFYHPPPPVYHLHKTRWQLMRELDYVGIGLFSAGLGVFLMGVIWAGGEYEVIRMSSSRCSD